MVSWMMLLYVREVSHENSMIHLIEFNPNNKLLLTFLKTRKSLLKLWFNSNRLIIIQKCSQVTVIAQKEKLQRIN